jgi:hypothetical protein
VMCLTLPSDRLGEVDVQGKYWSTHQSLPRIFVQRYVNSPLTTRQLRLACIPAAQSAESVLAKTRPASSNIFPRHTQKSQNLRSWSLYMYSSFLEMHRDPAAQAFSQPSKRVAHIFVTLLPYTSGKMPTQAWVVFCSVFLHIFALIELASGQVELAWRPAGRIKGMLHSSQTPFDCMHRHKMTLLAGAPFWFATARRRKVRKVDCALTAVNIAHCVIAQPKTAATLTDFQM